MFPRILQEETISARRQQIIRDNHECIGGGTGSGLVK